MIQNKPGEQYTATIEYGSIPTVEALAEFDPTLQERIQNIQKGVILNGHNPNGLLADALEGKSPVNKEAFVKEYGWLLALEAYPYRHQGPRDTITALSVKGLFKAGKTYNPYQEASFLTHASTVVGDYLKRYFGEPSPSERVAPHELETIVMENLKENEGLPPLPSQRNTEDLTTKQVVLFFWQGKLSLGRIKNVRAYESQLTLAPPMHVAEEKLQALQRACAKRQEELRQQLRASQSIESRLQQSGTETLDHNVKGSTVMPDSELLRLAIAMQPAFQRLMPNPSPGCVHIVTPGEPAGVITDINRNSIIPMHAWYHIKKDALYHAKWLASGTPEDRRNENAFVRAIHDFALTETSQTKYITTHTVGAKRAEPRHHRTLYGAMQKGNFLV